MNQIILGADGLVGSSLSRHIPSALSKSRKDVDITNYQQLFDLFKYERPRVVYLTASITNVDKCENPDTNTVNIRGATQVLRLCESFDTKLVYFSSSYVFDGKSKHPYSRHQPTNPIQNYGRQKETVENIILTSTVKYLIVRTVGVFGRHKNNKNFPKQIMDAVISGKDVFAPNDQYMNPIAVDDLSEITIQLEHNGHLGIWHVAGDECMTKFDFALRVAKLFGCEKLVHSISSDEMQQNAPRPRMGCLDTASLGGVGLSVPSFDKGLGLFYDSYS